VKRANNGNTIRDVQVEGWSKTCFKRWCDTGR